MRRQNGALTILETCMGLKSEERLLVVFDHGRGGLAEEFRRGAHTLGAYCAAMEDVGSGREPGPPIPKSVERSDVTMFCVDEEKTLLYGHSDTRARSCKRGARIGFLTQSLDSVPDPAELQRIHERAARMARILSASKSVLITSGNGKFELHAEIGRAAIRLSSIITKRGSWGAVPDYAEAAVAPTESKSEGELLVDGSVVGMGAVSVPVVLKFVGGRLVSATGGELAHRLVARSKTDDGASTLSELGFGANHLRKTILGEFDDKKMLGSVHVGLGDNHTIGGISHSAVHFDCLTKSVTVHLDGRKVDLKSV